MLEDRDEQGKFVKGAWKGGPGRPAKTHEEKYRRIFSETITLERFRASCHQLWLDSVAKRITPEGKLVNDPDSTPATRLIAFGRIAAYAMGRPIQPLLVDSAQGDVLAIFREMNSENLDQIIAEARRLLESREQDEQETEHE